MMTMTSKYVSLIGVLFFLLLYPITEIYATEDDGIYKELSKAITEHNNVKVLELSTIILERYKDNPIDMDYFYYVRNRYVSSYNLPRNHPEHANRFNYWYEGFEKLLSSPLTYKKELLRFCDEYFSILSSSMYSPYRQEVIAAARDRLIKDGDLSFLDVYRAGMSEVFEKSSEEQVFKLYEAENRLFIGVENPVLLAALKILYGSYLKKDYHLTDEAYKLILTGYRDLQKNGLNKQTEQYILLAQNLISSYYKDNCLFYATLYDKPQWSEDDLRHLCEAGFYQEVIDYCEKHAKDEREKTTCDYYKAYAKDKIESYESFVFQDELYKQVPFFAQSKLLGYQPDEIDRLIDSGKLEEAIVRSQKEIDRFIESCDKTPKDVFDWYPTYNVTNEQLKTLSAYDIQVGYERQTWHHANGGSDVWLAYLRMATCYRALKKYDEAISTFLHCLDIVRTDWKFHPDERDDVVLLSPDSFAAYMYFDAEARVYFELASTYIFNNQYAQAEDCFRKLINICLEGRSMNHLLKGDDMYRSIHWQEMIPAIHLIKSVAVDCSEEYPDFTALALELSFLQKSYMDIIEDEIARRADSQSLTQELQKKIQKLELEQYGAELTPRQKAELQIAKFDLLKTIGAKEIIRNAYISVDKLRASLNDNEIYVDFVLQKNEDTDEPYFDIIIDGTRHSIPNYYIHAVTMRKEWEYPRITYVGQYKFFLSLVGEDALRNGVQGLNVSNINYIYEKRFGRQLWRKILETAGVQPGETIYYTPVDFLNFISHDDLLWSDGECLNEKYNMVRMSSVLPLINGEIRDHKIPASGLILGNRITGEHQLSRNTEEIESISNMATYLTTIPRNEDIKESILNLSGGSPDVIYISTHGYDHSFSESARSKMKDYFRKRNIYSVYEKSMYLTGLLLANQGENREITAKELSLLNLSQTKLAILSSCVSGYGQCSESGVYGIQRALKNAGVKSIIVSLWEVDNDATRILFQEFFRHYTAGESPRESLRRAKLYVKEYREDDTFCRAVRGDKGMYSDPFYWAGFVLID